jgi:hypothetical protein
MTLILCSTPGLETLERDDQPEGWAIASAFVGKEAVPKK